MRYCGKIRDRQKMRDKKDDKGKMTYREKMRVSGGIKDWEDMREEMGKEIKKREMMRDKEEMKEKRKRKNERGKMRERGEIRDGGEMKFGKKR